MAFNVIDSSKNITFKYKRYLKTIFDIKDEEYKKQFIKQLDNNGNLAKGPYLDVINSFKKGRNIEQLINDGVISSDFRKIERLYRIPNLHLHQENALLRALKGDNLIVSTGTGSGKTECFLLPLLNDLMREKENSETGHLSPGVRALIIYPMNALANDQIDRLRKLLKNYPDITFGCYTGQTKQKGYDALEQYKKLNGERLDDVDLREPLSNEILSRDEMNDRPPHILITNYAMLEYLLLRPKDSVFFDGEYSQHWKYVILDEAHTYKGSSGIEVSMLLRRLVAKLGNPKIQYILTSATLGDKDANDDIITFGERLCNVPFKQDSIIRAERIKLIPGNNLKYSIDKNVYNEIANYIDEGYSDIDLIQKICNLLKISSDGYTDDANFLYNLLLDDETYWKIKLFINEPKNVYDIATYMGWNTEDLSNFVSVASRASYNGSKLFDARYHMFLRATEGVYITLPPDKKLFLNRRTDYVNRSGEEYKVYEALTCSQCHSLYILGKISGNYLIQKSSYGPEDIKEAFYIGDCVHNDDEDSLLNDEHLVTDEYEICPHCGFIRKKHALNKISCGHKESDFVTLIKVKTTNDIDGKVTKCIACEGTSTTGILRSFFTGQEASTSVIGTALFEELPEHINHIIHVNDRDDDGFGFDEDEKVEEITKAKQFIAFSDSRQAAAYYSSYLSTTYDGILYSRIINDVIKNMNFDVLPIKDFVTEVSQVLENNKIVPLETYVDRNGVIDSRFNYNKLGWQAMLKELVDSSTRSSLMGLGLLGIDFENIPFRDNAKLNLSADEIKNICLVYTLAMCVDVAMTYGVSMTQQDREFFTHNGVERSYLLNISNPKKYIKAFVPSNEKLTNKRLDYLKRILASKGGEFSDEQLRKFLSSIFDKVLVRNKLLIKDKSDAYKFDVSTLSINKNKKWYRCTKCKRLTQFNVNDVCPTFKCDGHLEEVDVNELLKNNHYYRMYNDLLIEPLRVVEHTAQLSRDTAYNYQNLFKDQKLDVLSCSTTFEMGVDVGDLETVFMRNMPPSTSNYAQRAGRAGRSARSAAFALTFCNKSNHDFYYFNDPIQMISGNITPPQFKVDNEKIAIRHLYSSALSFFFKRYPEYFINAKEMMVKNEKTHLSGYDVLKNYLEHEPIELQTFLYNSVPTSLHNLFELDNFGWVKYMFEINKENYPSITQVRDLYLAELDTLKNECKKAKEEGRPEFFAFQNRIKTYENEDIISFLSRNNILPKYGFPVDTVSLEENYQKSNSEMKGLDLSRDLSMAISEYAPGCQVVAKNKLITSRYIKKMPDKGWKMYDYVECKNCKTLNVSVHTLDEEHGELCECKQCGSKLNPGDIKTFIVPEFGFVADPVVTKPGLIKPERSYRTEASFVKYNIDVPESSYNINGTKANVAMIDDGPMTILNTEDFYVCPECGYAVEKPATLPFGQKYLDIGKEPHKNPKGYKCPHGNHLERLSLGYQFKTDVIRLRIEQKLLSENIHDEAYSILQAIILSACKVLDIENGEIEGCLQYYIDDDLNPNYSYILYDKTPGGAGHVKRINNQDILKDVLLNAYHRAKDCNCGGENGDSSCYGCLRTYRNQRHHDSLKRKYVMEYFKQIFKNQ